MALGALTATYVGTANADSAAFKALIDAVNCGAATRGTEITSLIIIPLGITGKASVWKYERAAA